MKLSTKLKKGHFLMKVAILCVIIFSTTHSNAQPGDPSHFPSDHWRAYSFNGFSFNTYRGYFDMSEVNFDSRDYYDESGVPSDANNYSGSNNTGWFHSVSVKRTGFECGEYSINVPAYTSFGTVYVDGAPVFSHSWSSGGQDNVWTGYLGPNSTIEYQFRSLFSDSYYTLELVETSTTLTVWNGSTNSDWFNASNWNNGVPNQSKNARITPAGTSPVIGGGLAEVKDLRVNNNVTLTISENEELKIYGDFNLLGSVSAESATLSFESACPNSSQSFSIDEPTVVKNLVKQGGGALDLNGSELEILGELLIAEGSLETGDLIILNSDADGTACLGPIVNGASITGEITVERYINAANNGWAQLASPVTGQTFANWSDDFITTGFPGSDYPSFYFNNIRMYDETLVGHKDVGLYNASHINDPIEALAGYQVYLAAGTMNIDVKGAPITGEQDFNVTFHSSELDEDAEFSAANDGWNLVANPYASTIDWDAASGWEKTNISSAIYVWDATIGQYNVYADGVGVNGGQNLIPSSQAFWVQTTAANPVLKVNEFAKTSSGAQFKSDDNISVFHLELSGNSGADEVAFRISNQYENTAKNVQKFYSTEAVPMLGIKGNDQMDWAIQYVNISDVGIEIPLNQSFPQSGAYTFSLDVSNYETINCLFLEDLETGVMTDLRIEDYSFTADEATLHNRFVLHFGAPLQFTTSPVSCNGFSDGAIAWNNSTDWLVGSETGDGGSIPESVNTIDELSAGQYLLNVSSNGMCGLAQQVELFIEEPAALSVEDSVANTTCHNTADGEVMITPQGGTAPYSIEWSDGNTSLFRSNMAVNQYEYTVADSKGCLSMGTLDIQSQTSVSAEFYLSSDELFVGESAMVFNTSTEADNYSWNMGDGTEIVEAFEPMHQYENAGQYTILLMAEKNNCVDVFSQTVNVSDIATTVSEAETNEFVQVWSDGQNLILQAETAANLLINVYNTAGQQLIQTQRNMTPSDQWRIPVNSTGVLMVQVLDEKTQEVFHQKVFMKR